MSEREKEKNRTECVDVRTHPTRCAGRSLTARCAGRVADPPSLARRRHLTARRLPSLPGLGGPAHPSSRAARRTATGDRPLRRRVAWSVASSRPRWRRRRNPRCRWRACSCASSLKAVAVRQHVSICAVAGRLTFRFSSTKIMREENADDNSVDWTKIAAGRGSLG